MRSETKWKNIMKQFKNYFWYFLLILTCFGAAGVAIAGNLINNPGFEASPSHPTSWIITGPVAAMEPVTTIDNQNKYDGKFALKMESTNPNVHGRAVQTVKILGGQIYLFNARFNAVNVQTIDKSILIRLSGLMKMKIWVTTIFMTLPAWNMVGSWHQIKSNQ